jgi:ATP-dependent Lhr-like helicase
VALEATGSAASRTPDQVRDAAVARFAAQLLIRWGVLFRDLVARETLAPSWRELLGALRRMEARGEIRGGRFVAGFVGEQFARPEAVDLLRRDEGARAPLAVPAADPLNLTGIVLPGPRVSPLSGDLVALLPSRDQVEAVHDPGVARGIGGADAVSATPRRAAHSA